MTRTPDILTRRPRGDRKSFGPTTRPAVRLVCLLLLGLCALAAGCGGGGKSGKSISIPSTPVVPAPGDGRSATVALAIRLPEDSATSRAIPLQAEKIRAILTDAAGIELLQSEVGITGTHPNRSGMVTLNNLLYGDYFVTVQAINNAGTEVFTSLRVALQISDATPATITLTLPDLANNLVLSTDLNLQNGTPTQTRNVSLSTEVGGTPPNDENVYVYPTDALGKYAPPSENEVFVITSQGAAQVALEEVTNGKYKVDPSTEGGQQSLRVQILQNLSVGERLVFKIKALSSTLTDTSDPNSEPFPANQPVAINVTRGTLTAKEPLLVSVTTPLDAGSDFTITSGDAEGNALKQSGNYNESDNQKSTATTTFGGTSGTRFYLEVRKDGKPFTEVERRKYLSYLEDQAHPGSFTLTFIAPLATSDGKFKPFGGANASTSTNVAGEYTIIRKLSAGDSDMQGILRTITVADVSISEVSINGTPFADEGAVDRVVTTNTTSTNAAADARFAGTVRGVKGGSVDFDGVGSFNPAVLNGDRFRSPMAGIFRVRTRVLLRTGVYSTEDDAIQTNDLRVSPIIVITQAPTATTNSSELAVENETVVPGPYNDNPVSGSGPLLRQSFVGNTSSTATIKATVYGIPTGKGERNGNTDANTGNAVAADFGNLDLLAVRVTKNNINGTSTVLQNTESDTVNNTAPVLTSAAWMSDSQSSGAYRNWEYTLTFTAPLCKPDGNIIGNPAFSPAVATAGTYQLRLTRKTVALAADFGPDTVNYIAPIRSENRNVTVARVVLLAKTINLNGNSTPDEDSVFLKLGNMPHDSFNLGAKAITTFTNNASELQVRLAGVRIDSSNLPDIVWSLAPTSGGGTITNFKYESPTAFPVVNGAEQEFVTLTATVGTGQLTDLPTSARSREKIINLRERD